MMAEAAITKQVVRITQRTKENALYWRSYQLDKEKPSLLFIAAFPATEAIGECDLTTMLILNNAQKLGFGTITIGNLFSISTKHPSDRTLIDCIVSDGIKQLAKVTVDVESVIIGVGSLTRKSKIAESQLNQYLEQLKELELMDKVKYLISPSTGRSIHPLGCQGEEWLLEKK